jgi:Flp pilus assembly protein TadB
MAQTKKKRRRKHRGTQAGNIERPGRTGRPGGSGGKPASRQEARSTAAQRRQARFDKEPTWRGSVNRAAFAAVILAIFISVVQKNVPAGIVLGIVAMVIYVPMSYYTDRALWRRRQRQKQQRGR